MNNVYKIFFFFFINVGFLLSNTLDHQLNVDVVSGLPLDLELYSDYNEDDISSVELFFKKNKQIVYLQKSMNKTADNFYGVTLPPELIVDGFIEYYFLIKLNNGEIATFPSVNPHLNPFTAKVIVNNKPAAITSGDLLIPDYKIIAPMPQQKLLNKNVVISLSYFKMDDVDPSNIKVIVDGVDVSLSASIRASNLFYIPSSLSEGKHQIEVLLSNTSGVSYSPIVWSFYSYDSESAMSVFDFSGKIWNSYINNEIDDDVTSNNTTNLNFKINSNVFDITGKFKKSNLENDLYQASDRYYLKFNISESFKIEYGDFYPRLGNFMLNSNRVRGIGIDYSSKFFQLNLIQGKLARAVQGNPSTNAVIISDYVLNNDGTYNLMVSRNGYTFERELSGLRIGLGNKDRLNFGFNLLKVKDDKNSVSKNISGATITLPKDTWPFNKYNSDKFVDFNNNGICDPNEPLLNDINSNSVYNAEHPDPSSVLTNYVSIEKKCINSAYYVSSCDLTFQGYSAETIAECEQEDSSQFVSIECYWDIKVAESQLSDFITSNNFSNDNPNNETIIIENLNDDWSGNKPKDNISLGSDFMFKTKNENLIFKSSFAMSLINENIWNPVKSVSEFDTISDEYEDCYYGRTYSNNFPVDYQWINCVAYEADGVTPIIMQVLEPGIALNDIPDPSDFEDIFHYNFDVVPAIPFYNIINKIDKKSDVYFSDFLNSSEVAYDADLTMKIKNHQFQFGVKKVGSEFNSLGNPYLKKDVKEEFFVDRIRFLENKMYVVLKIKNIKNGLLDGSSSSQTRKYDVNINYYPGINLPSVSLSGGRYFREGGQTGQSWTDFLSECDDNLNGTIDTIENCYALWNMYDLNSDGIQESEYPVLIDSRVHTRTDNYNIGYNHRFKYKYNRSINVNYYHSTKKDLLFNDLVSIVDNYVSPRSLNKNYVVNFSTYYNKSFESRINYSNSYYDFSKVDSEYYQKQKIKQIGLGFDYHGKDFIDKVGALLKYTEAKGNNKYHEIGVKVYSKIVLNEDLLLNLSYNYSTKQQSSEEFFNNNFKANLSYKF